MKWKIYNQEFDQEEIIYFQEFSKLPTSSSTILLEVLSLIKKKNLYILIALADAVDICCKMSLKRQIKYISLVHMVI